MRLRLTRAGWLLTFGAVALMVLGRLLGIFELYLLAAAAAALVIIAAASVQLTRLRLDVSRELQPARVHAGTPSRVELEVTNLARRRTPLLALRDPVGSRRTARVLLAPLAGGASVRAAYELPTDRRGAVPIGPLEVEVSDPFGLAVLATHATEVTELVVWPAIELVAALPETDSEESHGGSDQSHGPRPSGQEFHALRPYVLGDDLRRVHWASSARRDELMVRQDELLWQGRATVLLDTRRNAFSGADFERAVSAAASVIAAAERELHPIRLVTVDGIDTGFGTGAAHFQALMEHLGAVTPAERGSLPATVAALRQRSTGGAVAALLGARSPAGAAAAQQLAASYGHVTVVLFGSGRLDPARMPAGSLLVDEGTDFATAWGAAMVGGAGTSPSRAAAAGSAGR